MTAKVSIAATLGGFGLFTTGLLHWFTSPYVHLLVHNPTDNSIDVKTLDVLGRSQWRHISLEDVQEAESVHPLSSFAAGRKIYYVDTDRFMDKQLLTRLAPSTSSDNAESVEASAQGNKWDDE